MTVREFLKACADDKRVNICSTPAYTDGSVITNDKFFVDFYKSEKYFYRRHTNCMEALMDDPDEILDKPIWTIMDCGDFYAVDFKVVCA